MGKRISSFSISKLKMFSVELYPACLIKDVFFVFYCVLPGAVVVLSRRSLNMQTSKQTNNLPSSQPNVKCSGLEVQFKISFLAGRF